MDNSERIGKFDSVLRVIHDNTSNDERRFERLGKDFMSSVRFQFNSIGEPSEGSGFTGSDNNNHNVFKSICSQNSCCRKSVNEDGEFVVISKGIVYDNFRVERILSQVILSNNFIFSFDWLKEDNPRTV